MQFRIELIGYWIVFVCESAMKRWSARGANRHFGTLLETCLMEGPQLVTRYGVEVAVLLSAQEWRRLQEVARPTLKALLLGDQPRGDLPVPERGRLRRRTSADLA